MKTKQICVKVNAILSNSTVLYFVTQLCDQTETLGERIYNLAFPTFERRRLARCKAALTRCIEKLKGNPLIAPFCSKTL